MLCRKIDDPLGIRRDRRALRNHHRTSFFASCGIKCRLNLCGASHLERLNLQLQSLSRSLRLFQEFSGSSHAIPQNRRTGKFRNHLLEKLQPFSIQLSTTHRYPGDVSARWCEGGNDMARYWIADRFENYWDFLRRVFGSQSRRRRGGNDEFDVQLDQFASKSWQPIEFP